MHYIYCYENKINHHKYVGQTNNLKVRYSAHESASINSNSKDYNSLFHKKLREYGLNNFIFYVLEEINSDDSEFIDAREAFWIDTLRTWCRYGEGYNETNGGSQFKRNLSIDDDSITKIKQLLKTSEITFTDLAKQFNTYRECIARINTGRYAYDNNENYPLRITRDWRVVPQETKEQIAKEILNSKITLKDLAKKYKVSEHLVQQINSGESNLQGEYNFPLRKTNSSLTSEQEEIIKTELQKGTSIKTIANMANVSRDTVSRRKKQYNF